MQRTANLILKVIIHRRPLILRHAFLLAIHLGNLPTRRRHIRLLVIPDLQEPGKPQTDALVAARVHALLAAGLVARAEGEVGGEDLPDVAGLEPDVGLVLVDGGVVVERFGSVDGDCGELLVEIFEDLLGEAGADVADSFVSVVVWVVAGEKKGAVDGGSFTLAVVGAEDDEIERVTYASEIILLDLPRC